MSEDQQTRKPRIAVVFGGRSSEHAVSCATAGSVLQAIDPERYDVVPVGITQDGRWVLESADPERLAITGGDKLPEVDGSRATVALAQQDSASELVVHEPSSVPRTLGEVDVVFPLLHGPWGEDGTLQGLLEMAGVRYVGSGVLASAVGMDKHYMKVVLQSHGLPVLPYTVITPQGWESDRGACVEAVTSLGYPVFVKPARGGSSIGISKVHGVEGLEEAVEEARRHDPKVIVEVSRGRRPRGGVRGAAGLRHEPAGHVRGGRDRCRPGPRVLRLRREVPPRGAHPARRTGRPARRRPPTACASCPRRRSTCSPARGSRASTSSCSPTSGWSINEINTMPGFTPSSMFPRMWAESGLDYPALVDRLVQLALHRGTGLR